MGFLSHRSLNEKKVYQEKQVSTVLSQAPQRYQKIPVQRLAENKTRTGISFRKETRSTASVLLSMSANSPLRTRCRLFEADTPPSKPSESSVLKGECSSSFV